MSEVSISKNDYAESIVGKRPTGFTPIDFPCELGYHCPTCKYENLDHGEYDLRLYWSEYEGFLYCYTCNKDYPSALCMPDVDRATKIFLDTVRDAVKRAQQQPRLEGI